MKSFITSWQENDGISCKQHYQGEDCALGSEAERSVSAMNIVHECSQDYAGTASVSVKATRVFKKVQETIDNIPVAKANAQQDWLCIARHQIADIDQ